MRVFSAPYICDTSISSLFYRAMYYSAKHSLATACRPSVGLSVCPSVRL